MSDDGDGGPAAVDASAGHQVVPAATPAAAEPEPAGAGAGAAYPMPQAQPQQRGVVPYNGPESGYTSYTPPPVNLGTDPKLARLIRDTAKAQEEVSEVISEVAPKVTVIEEKLLGGTRKERGRRGGGGGISPLEMLVCLQQVVDEHGAMEAESMSKDDELSKLKKELTEAMDRTASLVEEKHTFLMQQNEVLMSQQADQRALVELQMVREQHTGALADLHEQLSTALAGAEGMCTIEEELTRLREEHARRVSSLHEQLATKEGELAECDALLAETSGSCTRYEVSIEAARHELGDLEAEVMEATNPIAHVANTGTGRNNMGLITSGCGD